MNKKEEVVLCHDMIEVPKDNKRTLMWVSTRTFLIRHLDDEQPSNLSNSVNENLTVSKDINTGLPDFKKRLDGLNKRGITVKKFNNPTTIIFKNGSNEQIKPDAIKESTGSFKVMNNAQYISPTVSFLVKKSGDQNNSNICNVCNKGYRHEKSLHYHHLKHFGYQKQDFKLKKCKLCKNDFKSIPALSKHLMQHIGKLDYKI